jgi:D-alanine-D-alanine ligase
MRQVTTTIEYLKHELLKIRTISSEIAVIVVANQKSKRDRHEDYSRHSLTTEYYADRELEEIITGFRENDCYIQYFDNEISFMKWVMEGGMQTINKRFKIVYNAASSGKGPGRKALIPAFCNLNNIALTSSDPYVVSLARHKYHCASILGYNSIPTPQSWYYLQGASWLSGNKPIEGTIVIAKPTYESASIGIDENSVFPYDNSSDNKLDRLSEEFNQPITVQEFIPGFEVEIPVIIHNKKPYTLTPIGLTLNGNRNLGNEILNYETVYDDVYQFYKFEEFGKDFNEKLLNYAEAAVSVIGTEGYGRIDFRITDKGQAFIMDVATYPHIIKHSSFWFAFKEYGFEYKDIFAILLSIASKKYKWLS